MKLIVLLWIAAAGYFANVIGNVWELFHGEHVPVMTVKINLIVLAVFILFAYLFTRNEAKAKAKH